MESETYERMRALSPAEIDIVDSIAKNKTLKHQLVKEFKAQENENICETCSVQIKK